jgi:hypothetical protein
MTGLQIQPAIECNPAMPRPSNPTEADFEEASSRLAESLKSCRSVVNDYRVLLTGEQVAPSDDPGDVEATD